MRARAAAVLALIAAISCTAAAQERASSVTLVQDPCPAYGAREFAALFALELSARGVERLEQRAHLEEVVAERAGLAIVHVQCGPEQASVIVDVVDLATGNQTRRELSVADIAPGTRPRALSLAVAHIVEAAWLELALHPPPSERDALPQAVRDALRKRLRVAFEVPAAREEPPPERMSLALFASARSFPARSTGLLGAELQYLPLLARTRFAITAEALFGEHEVSDVLGTVANMRLTWLSAGLGVMWASELRPEISLGPFARVGYGAATAAHVRAGGAAHSVGGFVTTLGVSALLRAALADDWDLWLGFDLGYTPVGVVFLAAATSGGGMAELTLALRAGLGLRF